MKGDFMMSWQIFRSVLLTTIMAGLLLFAGCQGSSPPPTSEPSSNTTQPSTLPETESSPTRNPGEALVVANYEIIRQEEDTYHYRLIITEENGVSVTFLSVLRGFRETAYYASDNDDLIVELFYSDTIEGNGRWEAERWFKTPTPDTYEETWYGTDANGNTVELSFAIATSEY
jgi:hypothetical protein